MLWREILTWAIVLPFVVANWGYWWLAVTRWQHRFRHYCERRFGVTISSGARVYWKVSSGSALRDFGIEWLQFFYFVAVITGWALGTLVVIGGLKLLNE